MPKGKRTVLELPAKPSVSFIDGKRFIEIQAAARLGGIHPVVLEMGQTLLKSPAQRGASFGLSTPDLVKRSDEIKAAMLSDLKKVANALAPERKLKAKSHKDGDRLIFWYAT